MFDFLCAQSNALIDELKLTKAEDYFYLYQGKCAKIEGQDDKEDFEALMVSIQLVCSAPCVSRDCSCPLFFSR